MALIPLLLLAVPVFVWYVYTWVLKERLEKFKDFPQAKPDPIWGHLKVINAEQNDPTQLPSRNGDYWFEAILGRIGRPEVLLLDTRPFMWPILVIASHEVSEQISRPSQLFKYSTPKSPTVADMWPITGHRSMLKSEGEHWKAQRKAFNAGFAPSHLITLLPQIIDKTRRFLARLDAHAAKGDSFRLDDLCVDLTFDIIGAVVMDLDFHAQPDGEHSAESPVASAMREALACFQSDSPFERLNPVSNAKKWYYGGKVDRTMKAAVRAKFADMQRERAEKMQEKDKQKPRSVVSIALQDTEALDEDSLQDAADQIKTFIFAGHDTTSILLQWVFYELTRHPQILEKLSKELDDVLGPDATPDAVAEALLSNSEAVLSSLPYLSAVIKEALRLYPPAGSARRPPPGTPAIITLKDGTELRIDGMVIYICHYLVQRDPAVYGPTATDFIPERWLGDTDTSMTGTDSGGTVTADVDEVKSDGEINKNKKIPATAWRPFERGPRNCIGQELANLEARVILAFAVRRYKFRKVGGMGELVLDSSGEPVLDEKGVYRVKQEVINRRQITSKPYDGMLMKVALAS